MNRTVFIGCTLRKLCLTSTLSSSNQFLGCQRNKIHVDAINIESTRCLSVVKKQTRIFNNYMSPRRICSYFMPTRCFCTKNFDVRNDPETRSLLKEINSDFEDEKNSKVQKETVEQEIYETNNHDEKKNEKNQHYKQSLNNIDKFDNEDEINFKEASDEKWTLPISLKRGVNGVFDLEELVTLLESENGQDIAVIDIPPEARFADHMVIVSAVSYRHLKSISSRVKWIHKQKKGQDDESLRVEGFETAHDWHAMDLGNIILHVFMPETRQLYDLETLWSNWGQPGQVDQEDDPYAIGPEDEFWTRLETQNETTDQGLK